MQYPTSDGRTEMKLAFIHWCCDDANIIEKMMYSTTKADVTKKINAVSLTQFSDEEDLIYSEISAKLKKFK